MTPVLLEAPPEPSPIRGDRHVHASLSFREIGHGYRPGHGLGLSIVAHQLAFLAIVLLTRYGYLGYIQPSIVVKPQLDLTRSTPILVLPTLGGGSEGSGRPGGGEGSAGAVSLGVRAQSRRGFAYPGLQPMVSNPPNATPGIQTILQPSLPDLPRLRHYVPLPNIVQPPPATAANAAHAEPLVVKSEGLALRPVDAPVAAPKLTLPVAAESKIADLVESKPQLPQKAVPDPVEASEVAGAGKNQSGLLVLNAIPPPPDVTARIPRGEARSMFAVSPGDVTVIAAPAAGTKAGGTASMAAGSGSGADLPRGDTVAEIAGGGNGTNGGQAGSGTGSGGRYGNAHGSGLNSDGAGGGKGRGSGSGPGLGTGSATGAGSGSGAGSAPGGGGFPGITIQGGRYGNSNVAGMVSKTEPRRQTSYNMNIVSTASSGGGLPDLGVFQNETVYTVYLDMRSSDDHPVPSWTLQYAVLQPSAGVPGSTASRIQGTPTPPYATLKEVPEFAPELVSKWGRRLIVASAILDTTGKLEQVSVRQSPDNQLAGPLVEALRNWIFEPAQIDGRPVALKILLGIRLAASR